MPKTTTAMQWNQWLDRENWSQNHWHWRKIAVPISSEVSKVKGKDTCIESPVLVLGQLQIRPPRPLHKPWTGHRNIPGKKFRQTRVLKKTKRVEFTKPLVENTPEGDETGRSLKKVDASEEQTDVAEGAPVKVEPASEKKKKKKKKAAEEAAKETEPVF